MASQPTNHSRAPCDLQMHDASLKERVGRRMGDVHRMGQGMVVHQMGMANKLSYMAMDDITFPGVVRPLLSSPCMKQQQHWDWPWMTLHSLEWCDLF